jgi:hypothetical protein
MGGLATVAFLLRHCQLLLRLSKSIIDDRLFLTPNLRKINKNKLAKNHFFND